MKNAVYGWGGGAGFGVFEQTHAAKAGADELPALWSSLVSLSGSEQGHNTKWKGPGGGRRALKSEEMSKKWEKAKTRKE